MTPSAMLAEKVRATTETKTDYATARALGVSQSYLKQVLMGNRNFGPEACVRASELLNQPLSAVLAEIELSKATSPEKKAFWEKRLPRILPAMAIWGLIAGVTHITDSHASVVRNGLTTSLHAIHYAYYETLRWLRALLKRRAAQADGPSGLGCFAT